MAFKYCTSPSGPLGPTGWQREGTRGVHLVLTPPPPPWLDPGPAPGKGLAVDRYRVRLTGRGGAEPTPLEAAIFCSNIVRGVYNGWTGQSPPPPYPPSAD